MNRRSQRMHSQNLHSQDLHSDRRNFTKHMLSASAFAAGALMSGRSLSFTDQLYAAGEELRRQGRACILLWMQGAPSQFETFDPKRAKTLGVRRNQLPPASPEFIMQKRCLRSRRKPINGA